MSLALLLKPKKEEYLAILLQPLMPLCIKYIYIYVYIYISICTVVPFWASVAVLVTLSVDEKRKQSGE